MKCYMIIIEGERPQHQVSPVTIDVKPWLGIHFFLMFKDCLPFNRNEFALLH